MATVSRQISVSSGPKALETLLQFCRSHLDSLGDHDLRLTAELAVEEIVLNILQHGYRDEDGPIELELDLDPEQITLTIRDRSPAFNPLQIEQPEIQLLEGKRGLPLVTRMVLSTRYEYSEDGWNILTIVLPASGTPMQPETASPLDNPLVREGVEYRTLKEGAVYITGSGLDAFIIDDGTATVLQACDGRSLHDLCEDINTRFGWGLDEKDMRDILERWVTYGYLEGSEVKSRRMVKFDPAGLLRILKPLQYLYGKRWVGIAALLLAATGFVLTFAMGSELITGIGDLARIHLIGGPLIVILGYYLGYSVTAFFHELGHALAIHRFDGEVPEIGIQRNFNFYVLSNRDILLTPRDRIWYYAGGLLSDTVWWVGAWIWWILAPGPVPLFLLLPQTVYFLVYAYAPSGSSDMAMILREAVSWRPLVRIRKAPDWRERWRAAPFTQVALEVIRLSMALFLLLFTAVADWLLLVLYLLYRVARKGLNRL